MGGLLVVRPRLLPARQKQAEEALPPRHRPPEAAALLLSRLLLELEARREVGRRRAVRRVQGAARGGALSEGDLKSRIIRVMQQNMGRMTVRVSQKNVENSGRPFLGMSFLFRPVQLC